jgi:hypothetical protein
MGELENLREEVDSLKVNVRQLQDQQRIHEEWIDTFLATVWWKRWLFILDGWSGHKLVTNRKWRPWHK